MEATKNTGNEILEVIAKATKFNFWMYKTIKPYLQGNILEIGSGIGNISSFFLADGATITLSDTNTFYIEKLKSKFLSSKHLQDVLLIDIQNVLFEKKYASLKDQYDSIFLLNVLEHVEDDSAGIKNCKYLLKPGGTLLILTPAYSYLYSSLDKALGHYRRYTKDRINKLFEMNNMTVQKNFYFNTLGIVGWFYGKILRLRTISSTEMKAYNKLTPLSKIIDKITFRKIGLSVITAGKK